MATNDLTAERLRELLGLLGVTLDKRYGTFQASIRHSGKKMHLGSFQTKELAHAAYLNAKRRFHDGCSI